MTTPEIFWGLIALENKIIVAGIGPGAESYMTPAALEKIRSAKFLVGGRRALEQFATPEQETCAITRDLDAAIKFIREKITAAKIEVIPSISAMQLAFARLSLPWHSATLLSFHGRRPADSDLKFAQGKILGLLTDAEFNSKTIARILLENGWAENSGVAICARLSYADEKIIRTNLAAAAESEPVKHCILIAGDFDDWH